ncbi:ABC transporter permease [Clostridium thermosuccinogenes]|uniref:ABC transporter permease n=2 Tax=Clostridium thermosuccinogenes TaxID=84032 RepID=A0A2K2F0A2_9CLOT|nr:ABC transporter permease [Pseudoclostridium thermosuccinogenes]PNT92224.1 ABC transporter permease [Pseudoclostridium thermosuccinogenes]PNT95132.1 ABC transporter permease [Pseudoclostridium thermosuccinogenes]PNT95968.1 ABC transporter permease [Pseudoclostridium thermosuccinogenes]
MKFRKYFALRILTCLLTIWIGVTFIFFIPRAFPSDPVENMIGQIQSRSGQMDPVQLESLRKALRIQFGLEGSLLEQYFTFLWKGLLRFDFGPSLMSYPTPVGEIISTYLPYTLSLSLTTTILAWIIGNVIGLQAGFRKNKRSSKILEGIAICMYPIPYFIIALIIQIVFAFLLGWFPLQSTINSMGDFFTFIGSLIRASILPAISLLLVGTGWWIISMKSLSSTTAEEDFVMYARYRGLPEGKIGRSYVFRNSILTQITALAMSLGGVFSGSIMTEIIFGYPGVGTLIQKAILQSDYNMILGCITISIVAISTATMIVDLIYPFIDPRIRYS